MLSFAFHEISDEMPATKFVYALSLCAYICDRETGNEPRVNWKANKIRTSYSSSEPKNAFIKTLLHIHQHKMKPTVEKHMYITLVELEFELPVTSVCYLCFMCVFLSIFTWPNSCKLPPIFFVSSIYHRFQMFIMLIFLEQIGNGSVPLNISLGNCWHTSSFSEAILEILLCCSFFFVGRSGRSDYVLWMNGNLSKNSRSLTLHSVSKHQ